MENEVGRTGESRELELETQDVENVIAAIRAQICAFSVFTTDAENTPLAFFIQNVNQSLDSLDSEKNNGGTGNEVKPQQLLALLRKVLRQVHLLMAVFRDYDFKPPSIQLPLLIQNLDMIINESESATSATTREVGEIPSSEEDLLNESTRIFEDSDSNDGDRDGSASDDEEPLELEGQRGEEDRRHEWINYFEHGQRAPPPPYSELDRSQAYLYSARTVSMTSMDIPKYWNYSQCTDCGDGDHHGQE